MKKLALILLITLSSSSFLYSQEFNQDFLKTLPQDIQDDIKDKASKDKNNENPIYRSIESQTKLEKKELEDLKIRLEKDLQFLKNKLDENQDNIKNRDDLIIFGSNFFSTYQSTFMPINEPNLNNDYILDFGDTLEVQLIGQLDYIQNVVVKRDGTISLNDIGQISIAGLSLTDAISLIKAKVSTSFIGTKVYISLVGIRDINVLVSGNAYNPGIYTVSGNSNMLHVLGVAGGINEYGSFREINLIRDQEVIATLDMYDVLITGNYNTNIRLRSGDIIFVKPVKNIISIDGAVKIPAMYEANNGQMLSDIIEFANGITAQADLSNIFLDRILDDKIEALPISNIKQFNNIEVKDGDKIFIREHSFRSVDVNGAVLKPGRYLMTEGESIFDLIKKAGGYTENAYPFGALYENQDALIINKMAKDMLYGEFIENIINVSQKTPGNSDLSSIIELTQTLSNSAPNGRIVIDLNQESQSELVIKDGDRLTIPEIPSHIYIYGEVSYEGALKYETGKSLNYYVAKSGGLKETADKKAIYVLFPNGDTQRSSIKRSLFESNPQAELDIYPGSIIFIPRAIDNSVNNRLAAQAYVSILGNIGIALASLSSINNN